MDEIDKKILNIIQKDFPIVEAPFRVVAEKIGTAEDEVLERIRRMKREGIIRRIGAVFDAKKLGYVSTLCAARVPEERLRAFVDTVNSYPGITHNYRRNHAYNVWFTIISPDEATLQSSLAEIRERTGIPDILSMKASRTFKIDASFTV
ncbi:MAG: Lrp/AsnC family transcriptional regulator [Deltaproteobacteria bacterium]|nr:Lrp/AsnC family transcriptional regulator [Deltaproteobacteria bacterium]